MVISYSAGRDTPRDGIGWACAGLSRLFCITRRIPVTMTQTPVPRNAKNARNALIEPSPKTT